MSKQSAKIIEQGTIQEGQKFEESDILTPENRARLCMQEIQIALDKYQCELISFPAFTTEGRVIAQIQLRAK